MWVFYLLLWLAFYHTELWTHGEREFLTNGTMDIRHSVHSILNQHSEHCLMLSPGTNRQRFRGQQEVWGHPTDLMNSCFSGTALFFDSFHPILSTIFFPFFTPRLSLCYPLPTIPRGQRDKHIVICVSPPLHLLRTLMLLSVLFLCYLFSYLLLHSLQLTLSTCFDIDPLLRSYTVTTFSTLRWE